MALGGRAAALSERSCGAMLQAIAGLAIGIPVTIFCVRYVKSQLFDMTSVSVLWSWRSRLECCAAAAIAGIIPGARLNDPVRAFGCAE